MKILQMHLVFFYNLPFITKPYKGGAAYQFIEEIGITEDFIQHFTDNGLTVHTLPRRENGIPCPELAVPPFYTIHYLEDHQPFSVHDSAIPHTTVIPKDRLAQIDFYQDLNLSDDISVRWDLILSLQSAGLLTLTLKTTEVLPSTLAYRLGGLYLNASYQVIDTQPFAALWMDKAERPAYVTPDELAAVLQSYFYSKANLPHVADDIYQTLDHRMQFPFIALEVDTACETQEEFIQNHAEHLTEFVFRPSCWEIEKASTKHIERTLDPNRIWSIAEDTLVVLSYEGAVYVKIKNFDTGVPFTVSSFHSTAESSVLFSFSLGVSDYFLVRTVDDQLDKVITHLRKNILQHEKDLRAFYDRTKIPNEETFYTLNELVIQIANLRFKCLDLLEEVDNVDKLIDEEWHIVLLDKIYQIFGLPAWRDSIVSRLDNLHTWIKIIENSYERFLDLKRSEDNQKVETRVRIAGYVFGVLAVVELIGLALDVSFDNTHPFVRYLHNTLKVNYSVSHLIAFVIVTTAMIILGVGFYLVTRLFSAMSDNRIAKTKL